MDIAVYTGVVVVTVSAIYSSYGYWHKNKHEQKRSARNVLYILLEIRHTVLMLHADPEDVTKQYLESITKKLNDNEVAVTLDDISTYRPKIENHILSMINTSLTRNEVLRDEYEIALNALSKDNPILAYSLRGKETFINQINLQDSYIVNMKESLTKEHCKEDAKGFFRHFSLLLTTKNKEKFIHNIDSSIRVLAENCSTSDLKEVNKILSKPTTHNDLFDDGDLEFIIEAIFTAASATPDKVSS